MTILSWPTISLISPVSPSRGAGPRTVFGGASAALVTTSALGVLAGSLIAEWVDPRHLSIAAGVGFVAIGAWTLFAALR